MPSTATDKQEPEDTLTACDEGQRYVEALGIQLALERKTQKLSQTAAAAKANLHRRTISDIENGNNGSLKTIARYCRALDVPLSRVALRAESWVSLGHAAPK